MGDSGSTRADAALSNSGTAVSSAADTQQLLRSLPAVGRLVAQLGELVETHGHAAVTQAARALISEARTQALETGVAPILGPDEVKRRVEADAQSSLRHVINATGVVLHTNLGRAPLAPEAREAVAAAAGYCNIELDLDTQKRGSRHHHISTLLAELLGTDRGLALNNCAGAVFAVLSALCQGGEVIVSRSELVEIGGGFRVPDVMAESGARLVEVGTTNKVYAHDYERAITDDTKALMVVHRANFELRGFTHTPRIEDVAAVARQANLPLLVDVGSGLLAPRVPELAFAESEPRPQDVLSKGGDLVMFSGDKLLGGPQAGIVAGTHELVARVAKNPLARALRANKLTLAGLAATLRMYRAGRWRQIPGLRALTDPLDALKQRAQALADGLKSDGIPEIYVTEEHSLAGGGCLPGVSLPTYVVCVGEAGAPAAKLRAALARGAPAIMSRVVNDRLGLDVRTLDENEIAEVRTAVSKLWRTGHEGDAP